MIFSFVSCQFVLVCGQFYIPGYIPRKHSVFLSWGIGAEFSSVVAGLTAVDRVQDDACRAHRRPVAGTAAMHAEQEVGRVALQRRPGLARIIRTQNLSIFANRETVFGITEGHREEIDIDAAVLRLPGLAAVHRADDRPVGPHGDLR